MKKNKMMRTASGLLVATLLTTSMISGTFAKYTTQDEANDSARVAKWGVNLAVSGSLYGKKYSAKTANTATTDSSGATVISENGATDKIVAPGTKNDGGLYVTLSGTPEVSTKVYGTITTQNIYLAVGEYGVMVKASGITAENFANGTYYKLSSDKYVQATAADVAGDLYTVEDTVSVADKPYYPVVYAGAGYTSGGITADSLSQIGANMAGMLKGSTVAVGTAAADGTTKYEISYDEAKEYAPNTDLANALSDLQAANISWKWEFEQNKDEADTILGDLIAANADAASNVVVKGTDGYYPITVAAGTGLATGNGNTVASVKTSFNISLSVTQVD